MPKKLKPVIAESDNAYIYTMKNLQKIMRKFSFFNLKLLAISYSIILLFVSCLNNKKIDFEKRIDAVKIAFEQKKMDSLQPYLANGYTIKGLPEGMESTILPIMLQKLPKQEKYVITNTAEEKRGTRLKVTFYDASGNTIKSNFLIAKDGKFLEINILEDAKISTSVNK